MYVLYVFLKQAVVVGKAKLYLIFIDIRNHFKFSFNQKDCVTRILIVGVNMERAARCIKSAHFGTAVS